LKLEKTSIAMIGYRGAHFFRFAALSLFIHAPLPGGLGGLCLFSGLGGPGRRRDQSNQPIDGVEPVLFLCAMAARFDYDKPRLGGPFSGKAEKTPPNMRRKRGTGFRVESKLNGRCDLVDVLAARPRCANEGKRQFLLVENDIGRNRNHERSVLKCRIESETA